MTQEEKEKAYDEALERAKRYLSIIGVSPNEEPIEAVKKMSEYIFPELAESEDEKIRKFLVNFIKLECGTNLSPDDAGRMLAWLEKQKEQKPAQDEIEREYVRTLKSLISDFLRGKEEVDREYYQQIYDWLDGRHIEQKPAEQNSASGNSENPNNHAEWSEEDEKILNDIDCCISFFLKDGSIIAPACETNKEKALNWLKSLRPQPKNPVLSEKMVICLKRTLDFLREEHNAYTGEDFTNEIAVLEWLITHPILISDTHWKPTEEQMEALWNLMHYAVNLCSWPELEKSIESLYKDLKKLM